MKLVHAANSWHHIDKNKQTHTRGYEGLRAQRFEKTGQGDLKEGFSLGRNVPRDHPDVTAGVFAQGPNLYPSELTGFRETMDAYFQEADQLCQRVLGIISLTLGLEEDYFDKAFCKPPLVQRMRLLHYPPQAVDAPEDERGIGAHTDFGAVTVLLQDEKGGLQVWDTDEGGWIDVQPNPHAVVVNLGNMIMRITNDRYISGLHRVINQHSHGDRYSVPFFYHGHVDFTVKCLPGCEGQDGPNYVPISVEELLKGRYLQTYGNVVASETVKSIEERRQDYLLERT